jgi:hypothetical protein
MMATVHHVTSSSGLRKFQVAGFLLNREYNNTNFSLTFDLVVQNVLSSVT